MEFKWNPTKSQRELFEEWKGFTLGYLVSCREGTNVRSIPGYVSEAVGEDIPLEKMGFKTTNHFLYAMQECFDVRKMDKKLFIFIRESAVPPSSSNIRAMVLDQAKDKSCKSRTGAIRRPTKKQSVYCRPEELLAFVPYRPPVASMNSSSAPYRSNNFIRPPQQSHYPPHKRPMPRNNSVPPPRLRNGTMNNLQQSTQPPRSSNFKRPPTSVPLRSTSTGNFRRNESVSATVSSTIKKTVSTSYCSSAKPKDDSWDRDDQSTSAPTKSTHKSASATPFEPPLFEGAPTPSKSQEPTIQLSAVADGDDDEFSSIFHSYKSRISKLVDDFYVTVKIGDSTETSDSDASNSASKPKEMKTETNASSSSLNFTPNKVTLVSTPSSSGVVKPVTTSTMSSTIKKVEESETLSASCAKIMTPSTIIMPNGLRSAHHENSRPLRGLTLDSEKMFLQCPKGQYITATLEIPDIKFPRLFRGGYQANLGLRFYFASVSETQPRKLSGGMQM